ncbi:myotubularin-related protein 11 isoform X1 [Acipenser ruthenus]|uniref:myotubularin-related protein 11 isoform X1 n=1 Tax=Acipenser ruthenus TaxID=7906 RepID=UPI002740C605|nr:myotubularin-related protein 11 isoform X1 [Acipenser ruthenus]
MLTGSKTSFKIKQLVPDFKDKTLNFSNTALRSGETSDFTCLPGERVLQRTQPVRKPRAGGGSSLTGALLCTTFRVAFVPEEGLSKTEDRDSVPVFLGEHDVALASIERVVAVSPSRWKVLSARSSLRFRPEELVLFCRDLRVLRFHFEKSCAGTAEITSAIARVYQPSVPASLSSFQRSALGSVGEEGWEMKQYLSNRGTDPQMNWFEGLQDWERELARTGATAWRVSSVNDRFEMATSLPKFNVVPQRILDTELKRSFAHFTEGRVPRWCWRHPEGSDLLRAASFQSNIYHEKHDARNLEALLFGRHPQCVIVEVGEDMPPLSEIQAAHSRLRALCLGDIPASLSVPDEKWLSSLEATRWLDHVRSCLRRSAEVSCLLAEGDLAVVLQEAEDRDLNCVVSSLVQIMSDPHCRTLPGFQNLVQKEWVSAGFRFLHRNNYTRDSDKEESPVFLLFLDCVWQLLQQFPSRFEITEVFLLTLHDRAHLPLYSTFLFNCQRERGRNTQHLSQSYTPVNGWQELVNGGLAPGWGGPSFPSVWDWALHCTPERRDSFRKPSNAPLSSGIAPNGNSEMPSSHELSDCSGSGPGLLLLFSKGSLVPAPHLLPWRNAGGAASSWKNHRRAPSCDGLPRLERALKGQPLGPRGPLLPLLLGPCLRVWRGCYLRGALQIQVPPPVSSHLHVDFLASEVERLRGRLALAKGLDRHGNCKRAESRGTNQKPRQETTNHNFLFDGNGRTGCCPERRYTQTPTRGQKHPKLPP